MTDGWTSVRIPAKRIQKVAVATAATFVKKNRPTATVQYLISFEASLNPKNICRLKTYRKIVCAQCAYLAAESEFGGQYPVVLDPIWSLALLIRSSLEADWPWHRDPKSTPTWQAYITYQPRSKIVAQPSFHTSSWCSSSTFPQPLHTALRHLSAVCRRFHKELWKKLSPTEKDHSRSGNAVNSRHSSVHQAFHKFSTLSETLTQLKKHGLHDHIDTLSKSDLQDCGRKRSIPND